MTRVGGSAVGEIQNMDRQAQTAARVDENGAAQCFVVRVRRDHETHETLAFNVEWATSQSKAGYDKGVELFSTEEFES